MDVTIDMDDVESTFEETDRFAWARYEFRRTHTDGDRLIAREYVVEHGTEFVEEISRFYVSGDLVRERSKWWPIDPRTDSISGTHQSIETLSGATLERPGDRLRLLFRLTRRRSPFFPSCY